MSEAVLSKVRQTQRRLNLKHFLTALVWSLTAALTACCVLVLADRFVPVATALPGVPLLGLLGGMLAFGVAAGAAVAWTTRHSAFDAALVLDRACGLKERVSTMMSVGDEGPAVAALREDVERRTADVSVGERVPVTLPRFGWMPAVPSAVLAALLLVGPIDWIGVAQADRVGPEEKALVEEQIKLLQKKLEEKKEKTPDAATDEKLAELTAELEKIAKDLDAGKEIGVKDAVLKLNDLSKSLQEEKDKLKSTEAMKNSLAKLPTMNDGPAQEFGEAVKDGDFDKAGEELKKVMDKLTEGKLDEKDKEKLAKQLQKMAEQMRDAADLKKKEDELRKSLPPGSKALKEELKKLEMQKQKMDQLKKLADKLSQCSKCMGGQKAGDQPGAASKGGMSEQQMKEMEEALAGAQDMLTQMQSDAETSEAMSMMMDELSQCKGGMCQGQTPGRMRNMSDMARGAGIGAGDREEAADKTGSRQTRIRGELHKGPAFITGRTKAGQFRGQTSAEIRTEVASAAQQAEEAVSRQKVPRDYKEHTRDYFEQLNQGLND